MGNLRGLKLTRTKSLQSCPTLATPWTAAHQAPLSLGFSRQEHCSGLPRPPLEGLPHPCLMRLPALAERVLTTDTTWEARNFEWCECYRSLSMGFLRQESCSGLSCPPPGDLPDPGINPVSLVSPPLAGGFFTTSATWEIGTPGVHPKLALSTRAH